MELERIDLESAEGEILSAVAAGSSSPTDLIRLLKSRQFDEDLIRGAIWLLIDQGRLDLTWDLQLQMPHPVAP